MPRPRKRPVFELPERFDGFADAAYERLGIGYNPQFRSELEQRIKSACELVPKYRDLVAEIRASKRRRPRAKPFRPRYSIFHNYIIRDTVEQIESAGGMITASDKSGAVRIIRQLVAEVTGTKPSVTTVIHWVQDAHNALIERKKFEEERFAINSAIR